MIRDVKKAQTSGVWFSNSSISFDGLEREVGDVILVGLSLSPSAFERSRFGERRYDFIAPEGWTHLEDSEFGQPSLPEHGYVFMRVVTDPTEAIVFSITQDNQLLEIGDADQITLRGVAISVSEIDEERPLNGSYMTSSLVNPLDLTVTRANSKGFLFSFLTQGEIYHPDYTALNSPPKIKLEVAEYTTRGFAGNPTFEANNAIAARCLVALSPSAASPEDPRPESGTGFGIGYPETDITNPLTLKSYRLNEANELELVDDDVACVACAVSFDGIGNCIGGTLVLATSLVRSGLRVEPFGRFYELYLNEVGRELGFIVESTPRLWYSGLLGAFAQRHPGLGFFQAPIVGLFDLVQDGAILGQNNPQKPPFIIDSRNYNAGVSVEIVPGTVDDFMTWGNFMSQTYSGIPDAFYGVGADRVFTRGTPKDVTPLILDASLYQPEVAESGQTDYCTGYYVVPENKEELISVYVNRDDIGSNIPEKVVSTEFSGAGEAIIPSGFHMPIWQTQSFEFYYPGILIPPVLCVNLPGGKQQYASEVQVVIAESGKQIQTRVRTQSLVFRGDS